jgi:hypothetical protein
MTGAEENASMATVRFNQNLGMTVLAIWLILSGLTGFLTVAIPHVAMAALAIIAGVLILLGR